MSRDDDRIPVPGNGHDRTVVLDPAGADAPASPATPPPPAPAGGRADLAIALTPGQLAVGFGIITSLILLALGRRRRGR